MPEGITSIEDLLGFTPTKRKKVEDEEGPPPYTEADIPAFAREEEPAAVTPAAETKEADRISQRIIQSGVGSDFVKMGLYSPVDPMDFVYTQFEDLENVTPEEIETSKNYIKQVSQDALRNQYGDEVTLYRGLKGTEDKSPVLSYSLDKNTAKFFAEQQGIRTGKIEEIKVPVSEVLSYSDAIGKGRFDEKEVLIRNPAFKEKIKAPETQLPDPAQLTLPITDVPPAEALVQRSAFVAPQAEAPSGIAEPSAEETIGGAGLRGAELPVSRPEPEGQGVAEPAGAGVGLPVYGATGAAARTEGVEPALTERQPEVRRQTVYRGGSQSTFGLFPKDMTADDVIRYEVEELGNEDSIQVMPGVDLKSIPIRSLDWVTFDEASAERYADSSLGETVESREDETFRVIAKDDEGGYLIQYLPAQTAVPVSEPEGAVPIEQRQEEQAQVLSQAEENLVHDKLNDTQKRVIAEEFGQDSYNDVAKKRFVEEVIKGINEGIKSVRARLRGIVRAVMVALLSTSMVFNPATFKNLNAQPMLVVAEPSIRTEEVARPTPPVEAARVMSDAARATYERMMLDNKGTPFIIADKPSAQVFLFKTDGSLIKSFPALYGKTKGDVLPHPIGAQLTAAEINKTLDSQKITPAGVFDAVLIRGKDYPLQLSLKDAQGNISVIAMHQVYTGNIKERRLERLSSASITDNRVSFGCINVGLDNFNKYVVPNYGKGARIGVVPDETGALDKYIPAPEVTVRYTVDASGKSSTKILSAEPVSGPETPGLPIETRRREARAGSTRRGKGEPPTEPPTGPKAGGTPKRTTRYTGWKSAERLYRDGEELILKRAKRNREMQKPPNPADLVRQSLTKEAYEKFVESMANILRPWKREQQRLENEGKLILTGPNANDVYGILSQVTGIARWYTNMYVIPVEYRLYNAIAEYGKDKGMSSEDALEYFAQFRQAMSADLRRDELFRRYVPLSTKDIYQLKSGKKIAPAALRLQLYRKAAELLGNQEIPREQKLKMLDDIRAHLDAIVSNEAYLDPFGHSMYSGRPIDDSGNNLAMSTNWDAAFYSPAEGNDPIIHTGPTLKVMEEDLKKYPSLRVAMAEFNKLQDITKDLKRIGGVWNEYLDDVSHFYGWGDGYSPLMMEKEDSPLNLEGTRNSGDVATFVPGMRGGRQRVANVVYQSLSNAYRAASIAARAPLTQRIANLIDTGEIPGKHMIDITPAQQFTLALENQPVPNDVTGGNVIINTLPDGTKQVYRMDDTTERGKKLLDGVRRVNEELGRYKITKFLWEALSKTQGVIASQFTRLRAPFAPAQFMMDSMTLAPIISADYGYRFGPVFLARAMTNFATLKGTKLPKLLRLYRQGNEAAMRQHVKGDPFLTDVLSYIKEGGPSAYAEAYKIEKGLTNFVNKIKKNPFGTAYENFTELVDNWTDSWDLLSRVSAMGVLKRRELEKRGYAKVVKEKGASSPEAVKIMDDATKRAINQTKELSNFNLHGNLFSRGVAALYMFWRPNLTTAVATMDMLSKGFEDPQARITRELSPEAQKDQELVGRKLEEFNQQRRRVRTIAAVMMGAGMALYELARAMSDYDEEGRNKVAISDKSQWIRAAQFRIPGTDWNLNFMFGFGPGGFIALGAQMSALLHGDQTVKEFSRNTLDTIVSMFSPITPSQISMTDNFFAWLYTTFSPTLAKPGLEYMANRTSVDTAIYNAHPSRFSDIYSGGKNVPDVYKDLAKTILEYTGQDIAPNKLYFFATHFVQAVNDIASTGYDIGSMLLGNKDAEDINWKPIFGSFISRTGNVDAREYYELQDLYENARKHVTEVQIKGDVARKNLGPYDEAIVRAFNATNSRIQNLQERRNKLNRSDLSPKEKKQQLEAVEAELNRAMRYTVDSIKQARLSRQVSKP
jgi:hypothetical protein